jgi:chromosomal replication initiation ATPase DnaA
MITPSEILNSVSLETGIPISIILAGNKNKLRNVVTARHKVFRMLYQQCYMSSTKIAKMFSMNTSSIRDALNKAQ